MICQKNEHRQGDRYYSKKREGFCQGLATYKKNGFVEE